MLYFFNPFELPVLRPVLARVRASLEETPRPAYIVVTGPPELAQAIEQAGFEPVDVERLGWLTRGVFAYGPELQRAAVAAPAVRRPAWSPSTCRRPAGRPGERVARRGAGRRHVMPGSSGGRPGGRARR